MWAHKNTHEYPLEEKSGPNYELHNGMQALPERPLVNTKGGTLKLFCVRKAGQEIRIGPTGVGETVSQCLGGKMWATWGITMGSFVVGWYIGLRVYWKIRGL